MTTKLGEKYLHSGSESADEAEESLRNSGSSERLARHDSVAMLRSKNGTNHRSSLSAIDGDRVLHPSKQALFVERARDAHRVEPAKEDNWEDKRLSRTRSLQDKIFGSFRRKKKKRHGSHFVSTMDIVPNELIDRKIARERRFLLAILLFDFLLAVVFFSIPEERTIATTSEVSSANILDNPEAYIIDLQRAATIGTMFLSLFTLAIAANPSSPGMNSSPNRWFTIVIIKMLTIVFADLTNIAFPTPLRTGLIWVSMFARVLELAILTVILYKYERFAGSKVVYPQLDSPEDLDEDDRLSMLRTNRRLAILQGVRNSCRRRYLSGQSNFFKASLLIFLLSIGNFTFEMRKTVSSLGEFIPDTISVAMNKQQNIFEYYGTNRTSTTRAVIMVFDGLNQYGLENSPRLQALLSNSSFAQDAWVQTIQASLPTMSVPNWMSIVTGTTPEMSGVWGNLLVPETTYDSLFRQARQFDIKRGITSSGWFSALIKNQLQPLVGDGTVDLLYDASSFGGGRQSNNGVDELRGETLMRALSQHSDPYGLFIAHFSDIDFQGHYYGADKAYNIYNSYLGAVDNKTKLLEQVVDAVDNNTLVVVVSDHGMLPKGGHGGDSDSVYFMPMIVYRKGSQMKSKIAAGMSTAPKFDTTGKAIPKITDLAPTVAAIMGLPIPRQNQGRFIDQLMFMVDPSVRGIHYEDLYRQTRLFVRGYLDTIAATETLTSNPLVANLQTGKTDTEYRDLVLKLREFFQAVRLDTLESERLRNLLVSLLLDFVLVAILIYLLEKFTFCSPFAMLYRRSTVRDRNIRAALWALLGTLLYFGLSLGVFFALNFSSGQVVWDSTFLHTPEAVIEYLTTVLVPTIVFATLLVRSFYAVFRKRTHTAIHASMSWPMRLRMFGRRLRYLFTKSTDDDTDMAMVYLCKYYAMQMANITLLVLFLFQSFFTFLVPNIFRIKYVTQDSWGFRFRVITVQFMAMPLVIGNLFSLRDMPSNALNQRAMDPIYTLLFEKQHHAGKIDDKQYEELKSVFDPRLVASFDYKEAVDYYRVENLLTDDLSDDDPTAASTIATPSVTPGATPSAANSTAEMDVEGAAATPKPSGAK